MKQSDLIHDLIKYSPAANPNQFANLVQYPAQNLNKRLQDKNSMKLNDLITWSKICKCNLLFNGAIIQDQTELINQLLSASKAENLNQLSIELDTTYNELYLFKNEKRKLSLKKLLTWCSLLNLYPEIKPINNGKK